MKKYLRNEPLVNTAVYYGALVINILMGWLITRINTGNLSIADYGKFSFFITFAMVGGVLFDFGFFESTSRLLALNKKETPKQQLLGTSLVWAILFGSVATVLFYLMGGIVDSLFQVKIGILNRQFPFAVGLFVMVAHLNRVLRGTGQIKTLGTITLAPRLIYLGLLAMLVYSDSFNLTTTLLTMLGGMLIALAGVWIYMKPAFGQLNHISAAIRAEVKTYGRHIYISTIWSELLTHADKFIISVFLDAQSIAYYALGFALAYPLSHFSTSLATSLYHRFAHQNKIDPRVITGNTIFVAISVVIFIFLREPIIYYLFSEQYAPTIPLLPPLALAFGFAGMSKPFTLFLMARKYGKLVRNISILIPSLQILLAILVIPLYGILGIAWVACFVYALDLILYIAFYNRVISRDR